jgi:hypothetical protein
MDGAVQKDQATRVDELQMGVVVRGETELKEKHEGVAKRNGKPLQVQEGARSVMSGKGLAAWRRQG